MAVGLRPLVFTKPLRHCTYPAISHLSQSSHAIGDQSLYSVLRTTVLYCKHVRVRSTVSVYRTVSRPHHSSDLAASCFIGPDRAESCIHQSFSPSSSTVKQRYCTRTIGLHIESRRCKIPDGMKLHSGTGRLATGPKLCLSRNEERLRMIIRAVYDGREDHTFPAPVTVSLRSTG